MRSLLPFLKIALLALLTEAEYLKLRVGTLLNDIAFADVNYLSREETAVQADGSFSVSLAAGTVNAAMLPFGNPIRGTYAVISLLYQQNQPLNRIFFSRASSGKVIALGVKITTDEVERPDPIFRTELQQTGWSAASIVDDGGTAYRSTSAIGPEGTRYVAWWEDHNDQMVVNLKAIPASGPSETVQHSYLAPGIGNVSNVKILTRPGSAYFVYTVNTGVSNYPLYTISHTPGAGFTDPSELPGEVATQGGHFDAAYLDAESEKVLVVYGDSNGAIIARFDSNGDGTLDAGSGANLTGEGVPGPLVVNGNIAIATRGRNDAVVVGIIAENGVDDLLAIRFRDDSWEPADRVPYPTVPNAWNARNASLLSAVMDSQGDVLIFNNGTRVTYSALNDFSLYAPVPGSPLIYSAGLGEKAQLAVNEGGNIGFAAWANDEGFGNYVTKVSRFVGGFWLPPITVGDGEPLAMSMDAIGNTVVLMNQSMDTNLYEARFTPGFGWTQAAVLYDTLQSIPDRHARVSFGAGQFFATWLFGDGGSVVGSLIQR